MRDVSDRGIKVLVELSELASDTGACTLKDIDGVMVDAENSETVAGEVEDWIPEELEELNVEAEASKVDAAEVEDCKTKELDGLNVEREAPEVDVAGVEDCMLQELESLEMKAADSETGIDEVEVVLLDTITKGEVTPELFVLTPEVCRELEEIEPEGECTGATTTVLTWVVSEESLFEAGKLEALEEAKGNEKDDVEAKEPGKDVAGVVGKKVDSAEDCDVSSGEDSQVEEWV